MFTQTEISHQKTSPEKPYVDFFFFRYLYT